ncbi:hypothetical protein ACET3Z_019386 [Daucus carota]
MDPNAVVFDLSSDDDVGWGKNIGADDDDCDRVEDCKWIQDFFNDDSDDVVFVSEVVVKPKDRKLKIVTNNYVKDFNHGDDDDDCVILDGDPDKEVEAVEGLKTQDDATQSDSDELIVVGETGQVACRDYPHPRHLCAKFSFTATPHEQYCNQCHCYVCDSLAPCLQWGTGNSFSDHCHATAKEDFWNQQRDSLKKSHQTNLPVPKVPCTPMPTNQSPASTPQIEYHIPQAQVPVSAPVSTIQYSTYQNQVPKPAPISQLQCRTSQAQAPRLAPIQPCSTTNKMPSIRGQRSGSVMPINNFQPNLTSLQLHNIANNVLVSDRRQTVGSLGPRVNVPAAVFKRRGSSGVALAAAQQSGYLNNAHGYKYRRNPALVAAPGKSITMRSAEKYTESSNCQHSSQQYVQKIPSKFIASQPPLQPHLSSQPDVGTPYMNPVPKQPLLPCQLKTSNVLVNSTSQPQKPYHQAYAGGMVSRQNSVQSRVSSQLIRTNSFGNRASSESPVYSPTNHAADGFQDVSQQQYQTSNFVDTGISGVDLNWVPNKSHDISQQPEAENFQPEGTGYLDESEPFGEFDSYFDGSSNDGSFDLLL